MASVAPPLFSAQRFIDPSQSLFSLSSSQASSPSRPHTSATNTKLDLRFVGPLTSQGIIDLVWHDSVCTLVLPTRCLVHTLALELDVSPNIVASPIITHLSCSPHCSIILKDSEHTQLSTSSSSLQSTTVSQNTKSTHLDTVRVDSSPVVLEKTAPIEVKSRKRAKSITPRTQDRSPVGRASASGNHSPTELPSISCTATIEYIDNDISYSPLAKPVDYAPMTLFNNIFESDDSHMSITATGSETIQRISYRALGVCSSLVLRISSAGSQRIRLRSLGLSGFILCGQPEARLLIMLLNTATALELEKSMLDASHAYFLAAMASFNARKVKQAVEWLVKSASLLKKETLTVTTPPTSGNIRIHNRSPHEQIALTHFHAALILITNDVEFESISHFVHAIEAWNNDTLPSTQSDKNSNVEEDKLIDNHNNTSWILQSSLRQVLMTNMSTIVSLFERCIGKCDCSDPSQNQPPPYTQELALDGLSKLVDICESNIASQYVRILASVVQCFVQYEAARAHSFQQQAARKGIKIIQLLDTLCNLIPELSVTRICDVVRWCTETLPRYHRWREITAHLYRLLYVAIVELEKEEHCHDLLPALSSDFGDTLITDMLQYRPRRGPTAVSSALSPLF